MIAEFLMQGAKMLDAESKAEQAAMQGARSTGHERGKEEYGEDLS